LKSALATLDGGEWVALVASLLVAGLTMVGIRPRLREYAF